MQPTAADTYIKIKLGERKAALARRLPGGWWAIVAEGVPHNIDFLFKELTDERDQNGAGEEIRREQAPDGLAPA